MRILTRILSWMLLAAGLAGHASAAVGPEPSLVRSELISARATVAAGSQIVVAIRQRLSPGWHSYWRNPGNIGQATRVSWSMPEGWRAGDIQWPTPHVYRLSGMMNFVYSNDVVLPSTITVPTDAPLRPVRLEAVVTSLLCRDVCVPTRETLSLQLNVAAKAGPPSQSASIIEQSLSRITNRATAAGVFRDEGSGRITIALPSVTGAEPATFFPFEGQGIDTDARTGLRFAHEGAILTLGLKPGAPMPKRISGLVSLGGGKPDVVISASRGVLPSWAMEQSGDSGARGAYLIGFLLLAFGGGLILNAMPCVFPLLAGKVATLATGIGDRRALRREALAYCLGSITAFLILAAILIGLRAMGHAAGWGFQLQSPIVIAVLALVMLASALNLAGLFEAGLLLQRTAGSVRVGSNDIGAFLTGVLAAIVAAPCTAPLMAPAIGWAVTQPASVALSVFAALGLGLGIPFLVLTWIPGADRLMPRPGPWLSYLRQALAFPMLGGAAWLVWIFVVQRGANGLPGLLAALIGLALTLWCWGVSQRSGPGARWRLAAFLAAVTLVPGGLLLGLTGPAAAALASGTPAENWTPRRVQALRGEGHPVLVDVTAAWCITCKVNETVALDSATVRQAMRRTGARILKADWTQPDARIEQFLSDHGRSGVPFYLLYAPDGREIELPQILSPQIVAAALNAASGKES